MSANNQETYALDLLEKSAEKWSSSPGLRIFYGDIFRRIKTCMTAGPSLEIGSGIGVIKTTIPEMKLSDVSATPYVDYALSAYRIEDSGTTWANIVAIDVLHHLREPFEFFRSAAGSLRAGGRIILVEPAATIAGTPFYRRFHHEPIDARSILAPYSFPAKSGEVEFANMGMGWGIFVRGKQESNEMLARLGLRVKKVSFFSFLGYAATGGFSHNQFLPTPFIKTLLFLERLIPSAVWKIFGLRMTIVLEKAAAHKL
jgi:hypothetical protein